MACYGHWTADLSQDHIACIGCFEQLKLARYRAWLRRTRRSLKEQELAQLAFKRQAAVTNHGFYDINETSTIQYRYT